MAILRIAPRPRAVPGGRRAVPSPLRGPLRGPLGATPASTSAAAADLTLADRHLLAAGKRTAGHWHAAAAHRAHPLAERVDLGAREVAGELHDVVAELAQRHLALGVTDDDVVDRGVADIVVGDAE